MKTILLTIVLFLAFAVVKAQTPINIYAVDTISWDSVGNPTLFVVCRTITTGEIYTVADNGVYWNFEVALFTKGQNFKTGTPVKVWTESKYQSAESLSAIYGNLTGVGVRQARKAFLNETLPLWIKYFKRDYF